MWFRLFCSASITLGLSSAQISAFLQALGSASRWSSRSDPTLLVVGWHLISDYTDEIPILHHPGRLEATQRLDENILKHNNNNLYLSLGFPGPIGVLNLGASGRMEATERAANWLCWAARYNSDREQYAAQYRCQHSKTQTKIPHEMC